MTTPTIGPVPTKDQRAKPPKLSKIEIKALVRCRDGYRCRICGMTARAHHRKYGQNLDVHRLTPGSGYTVKGCVTLCRKCHGPMPKLPRGAPCDGPTRQICVPAEYHAAFKRYAEAHSTPFDKKSVAWAIRAICAQIMADPQHAWYFEDDPPEADA
jgi:hypothetical protein